MNKLKKYVHPLAIGMLLTLILPTIVYSYGTEGEFPVRSVVNIIVFFYFGWWLNILVSNWKKSSPTDKSMVIQKKFNDEMNSIAENLINNHPDVFLDMHDLIFSGQQIQTKQNESLANENSETQKKLAIFFTPLTFEKDETFSLCKSILEQHNFTLQLLDKTMAQKISMEKLVANILKSKLVLVNLNGMNPNIYYGLGLAHAFRKSTILLLKSSLIGDEIKDKFEERNTILYNSKEDLTMSLSKKIQS